MLCFDLVHCAALAAAFSAVLTRHTYRCKEQHANLHKQVYAASSVQLLYYNFQAVKYCERVCNKMSSHKVQAT